MESVGGWPRRLGWLSKASDGEVQPHQVPKKRRAWDNGQTYSDGSFDSTPQQAYSDHNLQPIEHGASLASQLFVQPIASAPLTGSYMHALRQHAQIDRLAPCSCITHTKTHTDLPL